MSTTRPTRLILVRHGETAANREYRYIGSRDDLLNERGQSQAQALANALCQIPIHAVYCSPRQRTRATAQPLATACGLPINIRDALGESSFGAWEGMSRAEVLARSAQDAALLHAWEADAAIAPPGGESLVDLQTRVGNFAAEICAAHPGETCVLVSHVGPIKALIAATLQVPPLVARSLFLDPATISVMDWGERRVLRLFNSHAHLGWNHARWMNNE